jgi:hypothetical protein
MPPTRKAPGISKVGVGMDLELETEDGAAPAVLGRAVASVFEEIEKAGDRRHLQNVAPEIRPIAEAYFDQIEKRLNNLPEQTRRRPVPLAPQARRRPGRKRPVNR